MTVRLPQVTQAIEHVFFFTARLMTFSDAANVTLTQSPTTSLDKQHSVMDNTSITVVTLPNSNRQVYFQERTGALRRAVYSSQARVWQASADVRLNPGIKTNTPLAGVVGLGDVLSPANVSSTECL